MQKEMLRQKREAVQVRERKRQTKQLQQLMMLSRVVTGPSHPPNPFHFSPPPREAELNTLDLGRPAGPPWHLEPLACCQC
ncbi:hypothetical protein EYF80_019558 [Liparis tanakae]|uniref:Uncharacterized protein n=1 Tax=Liparis tanakae TaxID=230148 RepID=A0A4Z2HWW2_9TELE|nr:hypothetical protein EYF80_019558 [Liparis tanakae]